MAFPTLGHGNSLPGLCLQHRSVGGRQRNSTRKKEHEFIVLIGGDILFRRSGLIQTGISTFRSFERNNITSVVAPSGPVDLNAVLL